MVSHSWDQPKGGIKMKTFAIVLDAGHGGKDAGAVHNDFLEKDLNLAVMNRLREDFKQYAKVIFVTRDADVDVSLRRRIWLANNAKVLAGKRGEPVDTVLYFSIHWNGANKEAHGGEVWYNSYARSLPETFWKKAYKKAGSYWRGKKWAGDWYGKRMYIEYIRTPAILWEVGFTGWDFVSDVEKMGDYWHVKPFTPLAELVDDVARGVWKWITK